VRAAVYVWADLEESALSVVAGPAWRTRNAPTTAGADLPWVMRAPRSADTALGGKRCRKARTDNG
jgi:hypothetical protein